MDCVPIVREVGALTPLFLPKQSPTGIWALISTTALNFVPYGGLSGGHGEGWDDNSSLQRGHPPCSVPRILALFFCGTNPIGGWQEFQGSPENYAAFFTDGTQFLILQRFFHLAREGPASVCLSPGPMVLQCRGGLPVQQTRPRIVIGAVPTRTPQIAPHAGYKSNLSAKRNPTRAWW